MGELRRFAIYLFVLEIVTSVKSSYARCDHSPVFRDCCFARALVEALVWDPPDSCGTVNKYEVNYTQTMCNASNATVHSDTLTNTTAITLTSSSEVYCIQVKAVINENCYSRSTLCAQVAPLDQDHDRNCSVMMHGRICIPVTLCHQILTSRIFLSNAYNVAELSWDELEMTGVNRMYDNITNTTKFCFDDVNESFLFLEYCDVGEQFGCMMSGSIFCCNWVEFVSRTHVNVIGDSNGGYSDSLLLNLDVTPSRVSMAPANIARTSTNQWTARSTPTAPSTTPCNSLVIGVTLSTVIFFCIGIFILLPFCAYCLRKIFKPDKEVERTTNERNDPREEREITEAGNEMEKAEICTPV